MLGNNIVDGGVVLYSCETIAVDVVVVGVIFYSLELIGLLRRKRLTTGLAQYLLERTWNVALHVIHINF